MPWRAIPRVYDLRSFRICKYAHPAEAGARVADLYEVCGQAQRSYGLALYRHRTSIGHRSRERARTDAQAALMNEFRCRRYLLARRT